MTGIFIHSSLCIICGDETRLDQARYFAAEHKLPLFSAKNKDYSLQLLYRKDRIELYDLQLNTGIHVDFVSGALAHRQQFGGGRGQAIARAIGLKQGNTPSVLDVTGGLTRDAYILACLGCPITVLEQSPVLAELIRDGIERGLLSEESAIVLNNHFTFQNMDAIEYMQTITDNKRPDVIYIDPMYPERKKSALVKKDMQILQHLLGKDENAESLLEAALSVTGKRVVVKRPIHASPVTSLKTTSSISSKKTRYDIYIK